MYSEVFCRVYDVFGWNYYPEIFGERLIKWMAAKGISPASALDLGCGTGVLCEILDKQGIRAAGMDLSEGMIAIAREKGPGIRYEVGNMITYCPGEKFDLVTCTGDALNHIMEKEDVKTIFRNVHGYLNKGGYFVFDILNEHEVSTSEPFEMDFDQRTRVWFQMSRPGEDLVNLKIRVYEDGALAFEENIREKVHDPAHICRMLRECGFTVERCADSLMDGDGHGTTWFVIAKK